MDRIEAMRVFLAAADEGSLARAGRALNRSPAAVSRAIAALEAHVGAELLHRTTRALRMSDAGEGYARTCRQILRDLDAAEAEARAGRCGIAGVLTLAITPADGDEILREVIREYLHVQPGASVRLLLQDGSLNPVEQGADVVLRVGRLPDSGLLGIQLAQNVRRVLVASPQYLRESPPIMEPGDLTGHRIIACAPFGRDAWTFAGWAGSAALRSVGFRPRLLVDSIQAALQAAVEGAGVTRLYSYQAAEALQNGRLQLLLSSAEPPAVPAHFLTLASLAAAPKVRAFLDFATPRLRAEFGRRAAQLPVAAGPRPPGAWLSRHCDASAVAGSPGRLVAAR